MLSKALRITGLCSPGQLHG